MASIKRHHESGCAGGTCNCPWTLDYRPQGMAGARRRLLFPTKKAAERHQAETAVKVSRREYVPPAAIPAFAAVAQEWIADKAGPLGTGAIPPRWPAGAACCGISRRSTICASIGSTLL